MTLSQIDVKSGCNVARLSRRTQSSGIVRYAFSAHQLVLEFFQTLAASVDRKALAIVELVARGVMGLATVPRCLDRVPVPCLTV